MWMNEYEIERAVENFTQHPVLGPAARFLSEFRHQVNDHSDGWQYFTVAAKSAEKLMNLLYEHTGRSYPVLPEATEEDVRKTITPIKAFYTRRGYAAGMALPELEFDATKRKLNNQNHGYLMSHGERHGRYCALATGLDPDGLAMTDAEAWEMLSHAILYALVNGLPQIHSILVAAKKIVSATVDLKVAEARMKLVLEGGWKFSLNETPLMSPVTMLRDGEIIREHSPETEEETALNFDEEPEDIHEGQPPYDEDIEEQSIESQLGGATDDDIPMDETPISLQKISHFDT